MTKRLIIYGIFVAVLLVLGIVASFLIFGEDAAQVLSPVPEPLKKLARPGGDLPTPETAPVPIPPISEEPVDPIKVVSVKGSVRQFKEDKDKWEEINVGESLENEDRVRTGSNGKLTLGLGEDSKIELQQSAELTVGETSDNDRRLKLIRGRMSVDYREKKRKLRIESSDGSAAVEATESSFSVLSTGTTVAVATRTGKVDLLAANKRVEVEAGKQSVVVGGSSPSRPEPIPADVLFRLVNPGCRVQRERFVVLKGRTSKGAAVSANGNPATVDSKGHFSVRVPLKIGRNRILVVTEDVLGHRKKRVFPCITVDPRAPIKDMDIQWGPASSRKKS